ncbi:MAG: DUF1822 family protein [Microcystis panniformis]
MSIENEQLTFPVPLGMSDFNFAREFSGQQENTAKARQVLLNTLAVRAVGFYCRNLLSVETDFENSDSWDSSARILMDVADLEIKGLGKLECRPIRPGEKVCYVPPEVWEDRIAYVIVEIDEKRKMANILGFVKKVDAEQVSIEQLQPLEDLIDVFNLISFRQRIEELLASDWLESEKVLTASGRSGRSRRISQSSLDSSAMLLNKGKLISIDGRDFALMVDIRQQENEQNKVKVSFKLIPGGDIISLPSGLEFALLAPSGKVLTSATAKTGDNWLKLPPNQPAILDLEKLEFARQNGKLYQVKITFNGKTHSESFPSN